MGIYSFLSFFLSFFTMLLSMYIFYHFFSYCPCLICRNIGEGDH
jgi:hypothetical protein